MMTVELDLCKEILKEMTKLEFKESSIRQIQYSSYFIEAVNKEAPMQRALITTVFFRLMVDRGDKYIPKEIKLGLNMANDVLGWLEDMKLVVLPFLKLNEERFFG